MTFLRACSCASLLALLTACGTPPSLPKGVASAPATPFEERLLATIPEEWDLWDADTTRFFREDGLSVAIVIQDTTGNERRPKYFVVVDGKQGPFVSRVGSHEGMCGTCGHGMPAYSPDGRFAYAYRTFPEENGREGVMIGGESGPLFDDVSDPVFTPDGKRFAYEAEENGRHFVVFDHKPAGQEYDKSDLPVISPDGRKTAFRAFTLNPPDEDGNRSTRTAFIVVDGLKGEEFDWVGQPVFRPNGRGVAYVAEREKRSRMVGDASVAGEYDYLDGPYYSPDGRRVAWVASQDKRFFILVDGQELKSEFVSVENPFFSPDSRHLAFEGIRDADLYEGAPPIAKSDGRKCMVVDGVAGEDGRFIYQPVFAPNGNKLVYQLHQEKTEYIVFGRERLGTEYVEVDEPAISPDGTKVAFKAFIPEKGYVLVCGNQKTGPFDYIRSPVFSADGKQVGFGARIGRELWWKVMDLK